MEAAPPLTYARRGLFFWAAASDLSRRRPGVASTTDLTLHLMPTASPSPWGTLAGCPESTMKSSFARALC